MKKGDYCTCLGESDYFKIIDENIHCYFLLHPEGWGHGWENKTKCKKISSQKVIKKIKNKIDNLSNFIK